MHFNFYHQRESDGDDVDFFDGPEENEANELDQSKQVDTAERHFSQITVIRLVFRRHEEEQKSVVELHVS